MTDDPSVPPVVEVIPSRVGEISAVASATAPFLYFETAPAFGHLNGIARVTLAASRDIPTSGTLRSDQVVVAHLRMNLPAARLLIKALEGVLLLAEKGPSETKN